MCVECVGYILEELRDEGNYEQFKKDMAEANIFIGSLIFVQVPSNPCAQLALRRSRTRQPACNMCLIPR